MSKILIRASGALFLLLFLSACSWLPLPMTIDLKARLGERASGTVEQHIGAGEVDDVDFKHPGEEGECIDFEDVDIPVTVRSARINFNANTDYDGPPLTGRVTAQLHVAKDEGSLWQPRNQVGPHITVNLRNPDTRLAGTATLNKDQVEGINAKELCWGLRVTGTNVSASQSGNASIEYEIDQLRLDIRFSVI